MFTENVLWHDLEPGQWVRLLGSLRMSAGAPGSGLLLAVRDGRRLASVVLDGRTVETFEEVGHTRDLGRLAMALGARRALCLSRGALDRAFQDAARSMSHRDTYGSQALTLYRALRREHGRGLLVWPPVALPPLPHPLVALAARLVLPPRSSILLVVFEGGDVWTSVLLGTAGGLISEVTTEEVLGRPPAARGTDWRRWVGWYVRQAADKVAPPALGLFCTRTFWERLCRGPRRARLLRAGVARGEAVLDPFPLRYRALAALGMVAEELVHWDWVHRGLVRRHSAPLA